MTRQDVSQSLLNSNFLRSRYERKLHFPSFLNVITKLGHIIGKCNIILPNKLGLLQIFFYKFQQNILDIQLYENKKEQHFKMSLLIFNLY